MPYISSYKKDLLDQLVPKIKNLLIDKDSQVDYGAFEYLIFKLMCDLTQQNKKFNTMNSMVGLLETCKLEYSNKILGPYEQEKLLQSFLESSKVENETDANV